MLFKPELVEKIFKGKKTQTRRPFVQGDWGAEMIGGYWNVQDGKGRLKWQVGKRYAVVPKRGERGVGFIELESIRREDVRLISREGGIAEGFMDEYDAPRLRFLQTWASIYDPSFVCWFDPRIVDYMWYTSKRQLTNGTVCVGGWEELQQAFKDRPNERYDAWVLSFKPISR